MVKLEIDHKKVSAAEQSTILQAAGELGLSIPTLCFSAEYEPFTSCMLCVVLDVASGRLLPACSTLVQEGMQIETQSESVRTARRDTLELLLSEHFGDCEAPCRRICPAHMDISQMIRDIYAGKMHEAIRTVKKEIPLPAVLGRICPAPCEKGCNRKSYDDAVAICELKRLVADVDLAQEKPFVPVCAADSGKTVAVIGAGPAGLSAAYYLRVFGHACSVYDAGEKPGGKLHTAGIPALPPAVLDSEVQIIRQMDVRFRQNKSVGEHIAFENLRSRYDAVIIACGEPENNAGTVFGLPRGKRGIAVDPASLAAEESGVFAAGNVVAPGKMAVRAVAQGRTAALSVHQYLSGQPVTGRKKQYQSLFGKPKPEHLPEYLKAVIPDFHAKSEKPAALKAAEAAAEAGRCFHCDCAKQHQCKLRDYATEYNASSRYANKPERRLEKQMQHELVVYEPNKCIKCGLCVQITENKGENLGLAFIGRGFQVKIGVPFRGSLKNGLQKVAIEVVGKCPTGAMALKK